MRNRPLAATTAYCLLLAYLGLSAGILGPTLPALAAQTGSALGQIGLIFLFAGIGYAIGSFLSGHLLDGMNGHLLLMGAQLVSAAGLMAIPEVPSLPLLLALWTMKGIADGCTNAAANILLLWTHREKADPFVNALHFFFGVGIFVGPLLLAQVLDVPGGYVHVYRGIAVFAAALGLLLPFVGHAATRSPRDTGEPTVKTPPPRLMLSAALFLFFYVGAELTYGEWLYTYALAHAPDQRVDAAYLVSLFWFSFTAGRLLSIPAALHLTARAVLVFAFSGCLLSLLALTLAPGSSGVLWGGTISLGFFMAPIWPTGFSLAGRMLPLSGKVSSMVLLGDSLGGMILPWMAGEALDLAGPHAMVYLVLTSMIANVLAFCGMLKFNPVRNSSLK